MTELTLLSYLGRTLSKSESCQEVAPDEMHRNTRSSFAMGGKLSETSLLRQRNQSEPFARTSVFVLSVLRTDTGLVRQSCTGRLAPATRMTIHRRPLSAQRDRRVYRRRAGRGRCAPSTTPRDR